MKKPKTKRKASKPPRAMKSGAAKRRAHRAAARAVPAKGAGTNPQRVRAILKKLDEAYPDVVCALEHENPFQLLISTILSAQCTDVRVNQVTKTLYVKYPTPKDFAYADPQDLEREIRPTGFFLHKATAIIRASKETVEVIEGQEAGTMDQLLTHLGE